MLVIPAGLDISILLSHAGAAPVPCPLLGLEPHALLLPGIELVDRKGLRATILVVEEKQLLIDYSDWQAELYLELG